MSSLDIAIKAAFVGVGGTLMLDLYACLLQRLFGIPAIDWAMVGRWIGLMPHGRFIQRQPCHRLDLPLRHRRRLRFTDRCDLGR